MSFQEMMVEYLAGPDSLRKAVAGMTREQIVARPIPGKWSTLEVVCHISDFEPIYADRMKRAIAEDEPKIMSGDPDLFAAKLAYSHRDLEEELAIIENTRRQMVRILRTLTYADYQREVIHSTDGPITLETLLKRVTNHLPHHLKFIVEKRQALAKATS